MSETKRWLRELYDVQTQPGVIERRLRNAMVVRAAEAIIDQAVDRLDVTTSFPAPNTEPNLETRDCYNELFVVTRQEQAV